MSDSSGMVGVQVEQYLVQKILKRGGMGAVYLATDTLLDTPVALKFILSDFNEHPDMAKRFVEEAKTLAKLNLMNCPNIPILYRYFIWEGKAVMAMEFVPGETLEELVRRQGPIPTEVCVPLVRQALHGLSFAHRIGVIHRDLKPGNLMLNGEGTVKVIDFGIAKKLEVEAGLTRTNMAIGTPMYMAPEQIMGNPITPRTDIYLMGLVLYELLAGRVPFNSGSDFEISIAHVQQIPEPPTIHYPHIPKPVVDAVMKALEKDPVCRFGSVEEFLAALPQPAQTVVPVSTPDIPVVSAQIPVPTPPPSALASAPERALVVPPAQPGVQTVPAQGLSLPVQHLQRPVTSMVESAEVMAPRTEPVGGTFKKKILIGLASGLLLLVAAGGVSWFVSNRKTESVQRATSLPDTQPPTPSGALNSPSHENPSEVPEPGPRMTTPKPPPTGQGNDRPAHGPVDRTQPPVQPVAGQELSGIWHGAYVDSRSPGNATEIVVQLSEQNGKDVAGTLRFQTADKSSGECDLSSSSYANNRLQLLVHCSGPQAPAYFRTPVFFPVASPTDRKLSGRVYASTMTVYIERP